MYTPAIPSLEFPLGSESIGTKVIEIRWKHANATVGRFAQTHSYELSYRNSDATSMSRSEWERISTVPSSANKYNWVIPEYLLGSSLSIGIRSATIKNNFSEYSHSGVLLILPRPMPKPSISNPVTGKVYGSQINIILNNTLINEEASKLNRYRMNLYYSSAANGVSYAPIAERVSGSATQIIWNTSQLSPSDDYVVYSFFSDDFGRKGPQVSIGPFTIENQGYLLIDTDGPEVAVKIGSNGGYVRDRDIGIEIYAYDEIDGVHGFKLIENIRNENGAIEEVSISEPRFYQKNNFLRLQDKDGAYIITALVEDLAGNRADKNDASAIKFQNKYRKFFNKNGFKITAWAKTDSNLYVCLYDGSSTQVIRVESGKVFIISAFAARIIALAVANGKLYGSRFNTNRFLDILSIESSGISSLVSLESPDTEVSALYNSGDGGVLMGCINGDVYRFANETLTLIGNVESSVSSMYSGQFNSVFILTQSSEKVFIYNNDALDKVQITI